MAPWILLELIAAERQREAEQAVERLPERSLTGPRRAGALRSWLARTLYAAALCLDRGVAGNPGAHAARRAA